MVMKNQFEEFDVPKHTTIHAANGNLLITHAGMSTGNNLTLKVGIVGGLTKRENLFIGDTFHYDAGDLGTFEVRFMAVLKDDGAKLLVARIK